MLIAILSFCDLIVLQWLMKINCVVLWQAVDILLLVIYRYYVLVAGKQVFICNMTYVQLTCFSFSYIFKIYITKINISTYFVNFLLK